MNVLHLFAGGGGGILADLQLGHRVVGAVEWEPAAQQVLLARQADRSLDPFPIFGDVRAFVRDGFAARYRGYADCVAGGPPCQPFSGAGQRRADADERNGWPWFLDVVREVEPRLIFAENVAGLLSAKGADGLPYFGTILRDLAEVGYDVRWGVLSAADAGAPHRRKRLWIVGRRVADA